MSLFKRIFGRDEKKTDIETKPEKRDKENDSKAKVKREFNSISTLRDNEKTNIPKNKCDDNAQTNEIQERKPIYFDNIENNISHKHNAETGLTYNVEGNYDVIGTIFDIGKQCYNCTLEKTNYEVRCINCFTLECLHCVNNCECINECCCGQLKTMFKSIIEDPYDLIAKTIFCHLSSEQLKLFSSTYEIKIHGGRTTVRACIHLCFQPKSDESSHQESSSDCDMSLKNFLDITIEHDKPDGCIQQRTQEVTIRLGMKNVKRAVTIYSNAESEKENMLVKQLNEQLKTENIQVLIVNEFSQSLEEDTGPIIVTCLLHSRLYPDIHHTMSNIKDIFRKRIILVLLHFKIEDTVEIARELQRENEFKLFKYVDYFQQKGLQNIGKVAEEIKLAMKDAKMKV